MPGDGMVDESSFDDVVAHVAVDALLFVTFDAVLTAPELAFDTGVLPIFSIFGMINGVVCAGGFDCGIEVGAMGWADDCAFDTGTEEFIGGIVIVFDVAGNVCSVLPIFPNTS